jgi:hypothetical protein
MTNPTHTATVPLSADRPVLFWRPESDETHVQAGVEQAAQYLKVPAAAVVEAIGTGELLGGWFVDWEAAGASSANSTSA